MSTTLGLATTAWVTDTVATSVAGMVGHTHVWNETPAGAVDGVNAAYTLAGVPTGLLLFRNGLLMRAGIGNDYTLLGAVITFLQGNVPASGDILLASYTT